MQMSRAERIDRINERGAFLTVPLYSIRRMVCDSFSAAFAQTLDRYKVPLKRRSLTGQFTITLPNEIVVLTMRNIALYISSTTQRNG